MKARMSFLRNCLSAVALMMAAVSSEAQVQTLTDNNSSAQISPNNQAGMFNWFVDGQNQLFQQWFWYRVGAVGPEQSIDTISAPAITRPDAKTAYITYNNGSFSVEIDYVLTGQSTGSGQANINESIRIHNSTTNSLDFHFFQYSDFDLLNQVGGDTVALGTNNLGLFNEALQTKGPLNSPRFTETVTTPGANHGEANFYNTTLLKLNDAAPTTLNDNAGPVGPGDVTWALEWDYSGATAIAAGGDALISKQKFLEIPEPTVGGLAVLTLGACIWRRRCR